MADGQQSRTQAADESFAPLDRVLAALPQLSRNQQRIARFFLNNQEFVAFASAGDVGVRTRSSAATVVRLCRLKGNIQVADSSLSGRHRPCCPQPVTGSNRFVAQRVCGGAFARDARAGRRLLAAGGWGLRAQ